MWEMYVYYNNKANEMKWFIHTSGSKQQLASMWEMCVHTITHKANGSKMTIHKSGSSSNLPSCARCVRTITTRQTKWNNYTHKWNKQQLAFMCKMCAYYNNKANEMIIHKSGSSSNAIMCEMCAKWINYTQKWKQAATCLPCARCVRTITPRQTKWNNYTQKWKQQQLAFMCEICVYYNNKANEMKWLYTKLETAATCLHVWDVCEMK